MAIIIGLTGPNAAGKGEAAAYLSSMGFAYHSLSDVLRDELSGRDLPPTRENLIRLGNELRAAHGAGALAERIKPLLYMRDIVDSIRNPAEVEVLRRLPGFVLVGVDAPVAIRFQRAVARGRPGEGMTMEEFRAKEARENSLDVTRQQLAQTFALADHKVSNAGSLSDLHRKLDSLLKQLEGRSAAQRP